MLIPCVIEHLGYHLDTYRIDLKALKKQLGSSETTQDVRLLLIANVIMASQACLNVVEQPCFDNPLKDPILH